MSNKITLRAEKEDMEIQSPGSSLRFALCAEFGAGKWRMILFEPMQELCVKPFSGATRGKWYEYLQSEGQGMFQPVEDKLLVRLDGLEEDICLKISLPITFPPSPHSFGFNGLLGQLRNENKFISVLDDDIKGPVLCDMAGINRSEYYQAFVSLTSFNSPSVSADNKLCWSIRSGQDIVGVLGKDAEGREEVPVVLHQKSAVGVDEKEDIAAPELEPDVAFSRASRSNSRIGSSPPSISRLSSSSSLSMNTVVGNSTEYVGSGNALALMLLAGVQASKKKGQFEDKKHSGIFFCFKKNSVDSFFLIYSPEECKLLGRIQAHNGRIPEGNGAGVGRFFSVEYSHYIHSQSHVVIRRIDLRPNPTNFCDFRVASEPNKANKGENKIIEFKLNLNKQKGDAYMSFFGPIQVADLPQTIEAKSNTVIWCKLAKSGVDQFVFVGAAQDQSSAVNGAVSLPGVAVVKLEGGFGEGTKMRNKKLLVQAKPCALSNPEKNVTQVSAIRGNEFAKESSLSTNGILPLSNSSANTQLAVTKPQVHVSEAPRKSGCFTKNLQIARHFYPWIRGPRNCGIDAMLKRGVQVKFPDDQQQGNNNVTLSGPDSGAKEAVEEIAERIKSMVEEKRRNLAVMKCRVAKHVHGNVLVDQILEQADVSVEFQQKYTDEIVVLRGNRGAIELGIAMLREHVGPAFVEELPEEGSSVRESRLDILLKSVSNQGTSFVPSSATRVEPKPVTNVFVCNSNGGGSSQPVNHLPPQLKLVAQQQTTTRENSLARRASNGTKKTLIRQTVVVPKEYRANIVGVQAKNLRKLESDYGVRLDVPTEYSTSDKITILGESEEKIRKCKEEIEVFVDQLQNDTYLEHPVPRALVPRIQSNIQKLCDQCVGLDVFLPPHGDGASDDLVKIRGHKEEVSKFCHLLDNCVAELRSKYVLDSVAIPTKDANHSPVEFLKYLRGSNCDRIRGINKRFPTVNIVLPESQQDKMVVELAGPREKVEDAKKVIREHIQNLQGMGDQIVMVDPKLKARFLMTDAKLLREIKTEHAKCVIFLNSHLNRFEIRGKPEYSAKAKKRIEEILDEMQNEVVLEVAIPPRYHRLIATQVGRIREVHRVKVKLPEKGSSSDIVRIIGKSEQSVHSARDALIDVLRPTDWMSGSAADSGRERSIPEENCNGGWADCEGW